MSFNVWGLRVAGIPLAENLDERLRAMVRPIRDLDPDVIAFQEVWSDAIWRYLTEQLDYPFFVYRPNPGWIRGRMGNGLLVVSRFPLARERVRRFDTCSRAQEYFTSKGALLVDVLTPQGPITLVNTHLGSGFSAAMHRRRLAQLEELLRWVAVIPREHPVILAGDLNITPDSIPYQVLQEWIRSCYDAASGDTFQQGNPGRSGYTNFPRQSRNGGPPDLRRPGWRIDYILLLRSPDNSVQVQALRSDVVLDVPESPLSDHCAVLTRMEVMPARVPAGDLP
jgi:endonuclease/exonuclease/phosphatase family metal-dependent hydrolase